MFKVLLRLLAVFFCCAMLFPATVSAQTLNKTKFGKGLQFMAVDSSFAVKMNMRFQTLYAGEYSYRDKEYNDQFMIRRARLKFEGFAFSPAIEYKVELALSNRDIGGSIEPEFSNTSNIVLDAVAKWQFADNWSIWFGQTKLPGNRERVISSQKLQFVDRSLLNSAYNIDRDQGLQLHHTFALGQVIFREAAALSLGEGRNYTSGNRGGYNYTGRVEVLPFGEFASDGDYVGSDLSREKTPKLSIGVTYDYNDRSSRLGGQLGRFVEAERTLKAFFADAMFKYQGLSIMAEYADKTNDGSPLVQEFNEDDVVIANRMFSVGTGFNLQAGYLFSNNVEVAGRYTAINPEKLTGQEDHQQYTLGLSKYVSGHTVKIQSDVSLLRSESENEELMVRFQVEMGF